MKMPPPESKSGMRPRWITSILIGLGMFSLAALRAMAQESAADYLEPRIHRQQFMALIQPLKLSAEQRNLAELAFGDYTAAITNLTRQFDEQALQAGRQTVQDALAGKARIAPDELKRLRVAVLRVYEQAWPAVDQALHDLLTTVEVSLTPSQEPIYQQGLRELHRKILLHPRQAASDYQEYAGDGVDMLLLAQAALGDGGELQSVGLSALQNILNAYEQQLDVILVQTASEHRSGKLLRKIAAIEKDAAAAREQEQAALQRWKQIYQLNQHTANLIGDAAAATAGEQARQQWMDRFDQACFTWLYPRKKPDRQIEWIRKQDLSAETRQNAENIHLNYLSRRKALSRRAIELMVRGRLEFQTMIYAMMDPAGIDDRIRLSMYDELLKNSGEQASLESNTASALEAVLDDSHRQAMREALKGPDPALRKR
jgi:hypothetical protein